VTLNRKLFLAVLALLAGFAVLAVLYGIEPRTVHAPPPSLARFARETPSNAPAVAFVDDKGGRHLLADFRGHFVLLNLWATWCAPCVRELPALARLAKKNPSARLTVLAVAIPPGDLVKAAQFLAAHGAGSLQAYFDADRSFLRSFHVYGLPVTVLIDPEGHEIGRAVGPQAWDSKETVDYLKRIANGD